MSDQRKADRSFMQSIMQWDLVNRLKRNSDLERATVANHHGIDAASIPGFGQEVPWGNNTVIHQSASESVWGKFASILALTLVAGAAGYGINTLAKPTAQGEMPPIDAVLEWEITPDGDTRIRSIRREEFGVSNIESDQTSGVVERVGGTPTILDSFQDNSEDEP